MCRTPTPDSGLDDLKMLTFEYMLRYSTSELKPCCIEHAELSFHISAAEACCACIFHQEFYIGNWTKLCAREDSPSGKQIPYFYLGSDTFKWWGLHDRLSGDYKKISISAGFFLWQEHFLFGFTVSPFFQSQISVVNHFI